MRYPRLVAALVTALALALTGCSSADPAPTGKGHNDADVAFASDMIQHHAQALEMVDLTMGRELDPQLARLTDQIRAAQTPEIETMVDWLRDWGQRIPPTSRDHANAHAEDHGQAGMDSDMPGMASAGQMSTLEKARGEKFRTMWLTMMIDHHEGAVKMAQTEVEKGENAKAVALAKRIITAQQKEIATMQGMLDG